MSYRCNFFTLSILWYLNNLTVVFLCISAFAIRLFSVLRFESVIHEFDPYFNYRTTKYLAEKGFYNFHNWFDDLAWYPLGRIIGGRNCFPPASEIFVFILQTRDIIPLLF